MYWDSGLDLHIEQYVGLHSSLPAIHRMPMLAADAYWGEPERAQHLRNERRFCLSVSIIRIAVYFYLIL